MPPNTTRTMRWPDAMTAGMGRDLGTLKAEYRRVIVETQAARSELARLLRPAAREAAEADMNAAAQAYRAGKPMPPATHTEANAALVRETERKLAMLGRALTLVERDVRALLDANRETYAAEIVTERADRLAVARDALGTLSASLSRVGGLTAAGQWLAGVKVGSGDPTTKVGGRATRLSQVLAGASAALEALSEDDGAAA